jgi:hypothetical protein
MGSARLAWQRGRGHGGRVVPRVLDALTLAYGAAVVARPEAMTRPAGLEEMAASSTRTHRIVRAAGIRDVVSGATLLLLPAGAPLQWAVVARRACDPGDAGGFGFAWPRARGEARRRFHSGRGPVPHHARRRRPDDVRRVSTIGGVLAGRRQALRRPDRVACLVGGVGAGTAMPRALPVPVPAQPPVRAEDETERGGIGAHGREVRWSASSPAEQ